MVLRGRIVVEYKDKEVLNQLDTFKDINIYYGVKENYCLVYCNKNDENKIVELLNNDETKAYISNEFVDSHNF